MDTIYRTQSKRRTWKDGIQGHVYISYETKNYVCNNKSKPLPNSYPGVNELSCDYGGKYIAETKKCVLIRSIEHQEDSITGTWEASGATKHSKDWHERFNWLHPKTLAKSSNIHERKIRGSLKINNL